MPNLPEALNENVPRHVAEAAKRLSDVTSVNRDRTGGVFINVVSVLLENAVAAAAPRSGILSSELFPWPTPDPSDVAPWKASAFGLSIPDDEAVHQVLADEAQWLLDRPETWGSYGNALMRLGWWNDPTAEHSTSQGFEQVVLAVCGGLRLQERESLSILDPACGRGTLLSALAEHYRSTPLLLAGQDIHLDSLPLASRNLALAGRVPILAQGDLLKADAHPGSTFDLVVLDGPLGLRLPSQDAAADARYPSDLPTPQDSSWLMLMLALEKVKSAEQGGGTLVATLTPNALRSSKRGLNEVRAWIQERDLAHAVIALPDRVGSLASGIHTNVLVLSTRKPKSFERRTQVIDLRGSFEGERGRAQSRLISAAGIEELSRAIATAKPSGQVRTCMSSNLTYREWTFEVGRTSHIHDGRWVSKTTFELAQPADMTSGIWPGNELKREYGVKDEARRSEYVMWDVDRIFGSRLASSSRRDLENTGWPICPLLLRAKHFEFRRSGGLATGTAESPWTPHTPVLVIPLTKETPVTYGPLQESETDSRSIMVELNHAIEGRFLSTWLGTTNGLSALAAAREAAFGNDIPGRALLRNSVVSFLAHLLVPVPGSAEQEMILTSHEVVNSRLVHLRELNADLWTKPGNAEEIVSIAKGWTQEKDIEAWVNSLPYPLAIALRTVQAFEHDDEKAARQHVHFWEATSTFIANYLISSLRAADDLWVAEVPKLRSALDGGGLSFDRASLGTWRITIERLSRLFREKLEGSDPDERERALRLLGNPSGSLLRGVLDRDLLKVLVRMNEARNRLDGHSGTLTAAQAAEVRASFAALTDELRSVLGYGWSEFPMIRQVGLDFDDTGFTVSAEVLVGPTTPFLTRKLPSPGPLKKGRLYLLGDGGVVEMAPFVQLGKAPEDPETTCWFYNRREPQGVRLVAYQAADSSDVTRSDESLEALLLDLGTLEIGPTFPDLSALDGDQ